MNATMEKIQNSCRLCLGPSVNNNNSSSGSSSASILQQIDTNPLSDKLSCVFNFTFDAMDLLPKQVCHQCCTIVADFHRFAEQVQQNQTYLRSLLPDRDEDENDTKHDPSGWDATVITVPATNEDSKSGLIPPELVKVEPELSAVGVEGEEWVEGGRNLDDEEEEEEEEDDDDDDDDYRASGGEDSNEDEDWNPEEKPEVDGKEKDGETSAVRTKRKYTRRAPRKPKKVKSGHDPSKEYRSKPKEEKEEEDRLIMEYFKFSCELCHDTAETFIDLRRHFRERHDQKGYQRCCNKKLFKRCHLLEHIQVHLNPNLYGCDLCPKSFSSKEYLQLHKMQSHVSAVDRPYKCDKCPKSFIQKGQLSSHLGRHQLYPCSKCDKVLAGKGSLTAHMVNMHSDEGRMICDTCGREFKTKPCFDKHVRKHKGLLEDESIQCELCPVILHNKATLKKHMIAKHTQTDELFICNICNKQAPNKFALESHKRKVHCAEKYQCEFCEKRFKNPVTLKEHRASHTGEILYSCPFCTTTFNSKANMYAHRKKVHPHEWAQERMNKNQGPGQQQQQLPAVPEQT